MSQTRNRSEAGRLAPSGVLGASTLDSDVEGASTAHGVVTRRMPEKENR